MLPQEASVQWILRIRTGLGHEDDVAIVGKFQVGAAESFDVDDVALLFVELVDVNMLYCSDFQDIFNLDLSLFGLLEAVHAMVLGVVRGRVRMDAAKVRSSSGLAEL